VQVHGGVRFPPVDRCLPHLRSNSRVEDSESRGSERPQPDGAAPPRNGNGGPSGARACRRAVT
jgi:hypothetical protein